MPFRYNHRLRAAAARPASESASHPKGVDRVLFVFFAALLTGLAALFAPAARAAGEARVLGTGTAEDPPRLTVVSQDANGLTVDFVLPSLVVSDVVAAGETFQEIAIPWGSLEGAVGTPGLPAFSRFLAVPEGRSARVSAVVEEEEELAGFRLFPVQAEEGGFALDHAAYARTGFGNAAPARAGSPARMGSLRVLPVTFSPVRHSPVEGKIRVVRRMRVSVEFTADEGAGRPGPDGSGSGFNPGFGPGSGAGRGFGPGTGTAPAGDPRPVPLSFARLYQDLVINSPVTERDAAPGSWLIICPDDANVIAALQPLVSWRNRMGLSATLVTTAQTGTVNSQIKDYIQNAYDTWNPPLEYVVLAGDATEPYSVATWLENQSGYGGEGDHPYSLLAGDDELSDIHVGRLSYNTLNELSTIVNKIVSYESAPFVQDQFWFARACLVGDPSSGFSTIQVMQWVKTRLRQLGYSQIDTVFSGDYVSQMIVDLNRGDSVFSYRGYLGMSGWSNSQCYAMANGPRMPFAVISTCGTGSFASETSISEAFLRAGTPTSPKAAIGATGTATWGTHTRFNNCYVCGVFAGLLYEDQFTLGAAHTRGKYELYLNYHDSPQSGYIGIFSHWNNLMGDPATECWTGLPLPLTVTRPAGLYVGSSSLQVNVTDAGGPLASARVCASKGSETWQVGFTDAQGNCELPLSLATSGDLLLTVTGHNRRPSLITIPVTNPQRLVSYVSSIIDDDASGPSEGNGNGQINPGETVELSVQVRNFGSEGVPGVTAVLSSDDPYVTVLTPSGAFGDIPAGGTAGNAQPFVFSVDPGCPHGHPLRFALDLASGADQWHSLVVLDPVSVRLEFLSLHVDLPGNGVLDPGETTQLSVELANTGPIDALTPSATILPLNSFIDVPGSVGSYATILADSSGENTGARFTVRAHNGTYRGSMGDMLMVLTCADGVRDSVRFQIPVGVRTSADPCGPDAYGYWAFDNTDTAYPEAPAYSWVEVDPAFGGGGSEITLGDYGNDQDKSAPVTLPFPFTYYGVPYTTATVCSNGWLVMGSTYLTDYRNWTIPAANGPNGVIAAFWDDLYQTAGSSRVVQRFDSANHRWIVEWSRMHNLSGDGLETFEIILYDPAFHPTDTGDGRIEFQYQTVNIADPTDGYMTVGIEKPDNSQGVLYTYFNNYAPGAAPVGNGRAIRFVPRSTDPTAVPEPALAGSAVFFGFGGSSPNPLRPGQAISFSLREPGPVRLDVFDLQGRVVRRLLRGELAAGPHAVVWDGRDDAGREAGAGVYLYRLSSGDREETRKGVLAR